MNPMAKARGLQLGRLARRVRLHDGSCRTNAPQGTAFERYVGKSKPPAAPSNEIPYWPYCEQCQKPLDFDKHEPFAYCDCGVHEAGEPRPAPYVLDPNLLVTEEFYCGCARSSYWRRCEGHRDLDHDEEPPVQVPYRPEPTEWRCQIRNERGTWHTVAYLYKGEDAQQWQDQDPDNRRIVPLGPYAQHPTEWRGEDFTHGVWRFRQYFRDESKAEDWQARYPEFRRLIPLAPSVEGWKGVEP